MGTPLGGASVLHSMGEEAASGTGTSAGALVDADSNTPEPTREEGGGRMGARRAEESRGGDASCEGT